MTEGQRVTFVSHTNKPGGAELALRRYLQATELPVRLVTVEDGGVWEGLGTKVVKVDGVWRLRQSLRGSDLVVANSMRAAFLTALVMPRSLRLVYWVRDGLTDSAMSRTALTLTKYVTARRVQHYLANSDWTASTVRDSLRVPAHRVRVVHSMCGVRAKDLVRPARLGPHSPVRLLYLGRIAPWKGPHLAVHAVEELHKLGVATSLTLAGGSHFGEETYNAEVLRLVQRQPAVNMVGHVEDVVSLLAQHDVLLHCSTLPEPFGQVIVQALAAGMPVVAPNAGGPAEILSDAPNQLTYEPGDVYGMATAVLRAIEKFELISAWGVSRAGRYTDEELLLQTDEVLTALSHPGSPSGSRMA